MSTNSTQNLELTKMDYFRNTIKLAIPSIVENLASVIVGFVDTIMVARLGTLATASVSVNTSFTWFLSSIPQLYIVGTTVMVAQSIGSRREDMAKKYAAQGITGSIVLFSLMFLVTFFLSSYVPGWMGAEESYLSDAVAYLKIYSLSIIPMFVGRVASSIIRGTGNTKAPMLVALFVNVIHIIFNYFFIYETRIITIPVLNKAITMWGAGWGVPGAAISTALSNSIGGIILIVLLFNHSQVITLHLKDLFAFDKTATSRIFKVGMPAAGENIFTNIGQLIFHRMVNILGSIQTAAHGLANQAESFSYMPAYGLSVASTTLIGQSMGEKNKKHAENYAKLCVSMAMSVGAIMGMILFLFATPIMSLFTHDEAVLSEGVRALKIIALIQPFFHTSTVLIGILRGAGDTIVPLIAGLGGMFVVRLTCTQLFITYFDMGLAGAWTGMAIDHVVRFIFIYSRYRRKKWLEYEVIIDE